MKVGVVGAGAIAVKSQISILSRLQNVELAGICDKQLSLAKDAGAKFGINDVFQDLDEMLSKKKLDAVVICTPPLTHSALTIQAMNGGCHVLVEKPMATSVQDADAMIDAAKKNNVRLGVVHHNLFNPAVLKAKQLVNSGAVGDVLHVEVRTSESINSKFCTTKDHWCHKLPGGIFYEIMPHPVYVAQFFLEDAKVVDVIAKKFSNREYMKNDEVRVSLEGKRGLGTIIVSCNSFIHGDTLDIFGSKMAIHADITSRSIILFKRHSASKMSVGLSNLGLSAQMLKVLGTTTSNLLKSCRGRETCHYYLIRQYIQSLINKTEFVATAEKGRATVSLLDQICGQI